ncbi:MAG: transporter substrate-binding domain-containing protein [bacterium LCO1.1]|uniref:Transporter substrate-binding domain-containing protein n=1 Tax=Candidatus Weimeria bifida TaxID=2599074 RepID=A0A6N7IZX8_9FIRM|nr:transporter substrate-binding domain-containing protein [Candidatus Weimeria bifida]
MKLFPAPLSDSLTSESYAIACPKGSDLTAEINKVLKDLKDSGKLQKIMDEYISEK